MASVCPHYPGERAQNSAKRATTNAHIQLSTGMFTTVSSTHLTVGGVKVGKIRTKPVWRQKPACLSLIFYWQIRVIGS